MVSFFAWMDYSEQERRKALDVIDLFREQDTRDELGIGTVRDALADLLFPGTTTIQTRARYFLFVPWTYLELERLRVPSGQMDVRARREEIALIEALVKSDDQDGIIGIDARAALKRLPSSIYWIGLRRWGIRLFPGSQDQYHRSLDALYAYHFHFGQSRRSDEGEPVDDGVPLNWHAGIPSRPKGFPRDASIHLLRGEAEYLRECILAHAPGTLLAFNVDRGTPFDEVEFIWQHPLVAQLPDAIAEQVEHARAFSETIHGAALLYNLMLGELAPIQERIDHYRRELQQWAARLLERTGVLSRWDRARFWEIVESRGTRIPLRTRRFIDAWLDLILKGTSLRETTRTIATNERARSLIHKRERSIKGDRSRLDNRRALELWSGAAGTAQLNYRWPVVQTIILDILTGLRAEDQDA